MIFNFGEMSHHLKIIVSIDECKKADLEIIWNCEFCGNSFDLMLWFCLIESSLVDVTIKKFD